MSASKALSSSVSVAGSPPTLSVDDAAFLCQITERLTNRAQTVMRGVFKSGGFYKTGGVNCDLAKISSPGRFPLGSYRVVVQLDTTGTYYAVYHHANKKLQIYSALGTEVADGTDINALIFPFMAVGE